MPRNTLAIDRISGGMTRVRMTGMNDRSVSVIGTDFAPDQVRRIVGDLCRCAGLPAPWKD